MACLLPPHEGMNNTTSNREGARPSLWEQTAQLPTPESIAGDLTADVAVIGAGMAGLSVAYELTARGRTVIVLDDGPIAGGESGRTTAHIATAFDDYYSEVEHMHGERAAALLGESFRAGVDRIEEIVRAEGIDCDFVRLDGFWFAPDDGEGNDPEADAKTLADEREAAHRAGLTGVELVETWPLAGTMPGASPRAVLRFPDQAQFHPVRYLAGLAAAISRRGGRIVSGAHATEVQDDDDEGGCTIRIDGGYTVRARDVVVATNTPFNDRVTMHTKQAPYRTYVIAARVRRGAVPRALYWDTLDPYHYIRLLATSDESETGHDVLIVGGEDHKTGQEDDENVHFASLERWARARFPIEDVVSRWSGQVLEPMDYVAYIGRNPGDKHVWIVTGDSGNGITHGAVAGLLLAALVTTGEHRWAPLYDPSRITLRAARTWVEENVNVAAQYADLVTGGDVKSVDDIPVGQGRVLRDGARKVAVYRGEDGSLTCRSAICTHLGCVVDWNNAERTWDCPCHGSRFATDGTVLNGPAPTALPEAELPRS